MGYDMYIKGPMTQEEEAKYKHARDAFKTAVRERDELPVTTAAYQAAERDLQTAVAQLETEGRSDALLEAIIEGKSVMRRLRASHPGYKAAQQKVEEAYEAEKAAHVSYFRLNIHGMGMFREAMMFAWHAHD